MKKELLSGIEVDAQQYYKLLEWKDQNMSLFLWWCKENNYHYASINVMTQDEYNKLIKYAKIK